MSPSPVNGHAPTFFSHAPVVLTWWKKVSHKHRRRSLMVSASPLVFECEQEQLYQSHWRCKLWERGNKTSPSIYFSGLEMFTFNQRGGEQEGKVESVSEETRNILGRKERIIKQGLKAGIYCASGIASELESIWSRGKTECCCHGPRREWHSSLSMWTSEDAVISYGYEGSILF